MFELEYDDYYYMFPILGLISIFYLIYMQAVAMNAKGKELLASREGSSKSSKKVKKASSKDETKSNSDK